jgi:hypothetical protein
MPKKTREYWESCEHFLTKDKDSFVVVRSEKGVVSNVEIKSCCFCKHGIPVSLEPNAWTNGYICTRQTKTQSLVSWLICSPAWFFIKIWLDRKRKKERDEEDERYSEVVRTQAAQRKHPIRR